MTHASIHVHRVDSVTQELVDSFRRLLPMLSKSATQPSRDQLEEIVASQCLLIARDSDESDKIVGSLTLVTFRIPTGVRAWIEDVVVDESTRGKGVGEQLTREAMAIAARSGAKTIDLTSNQSRVAAHRLYQKVGFVVRETSVYRFVPNTSAKPGEA